MHSMRWIGPAVLSLLLAACNNGEEAEGGATLSDADQAKATQMLQAYEDARTAGNPEAAEAQADKLRGKYPDSEAAHKLDATLDEVRKQSEQARDTRRLKAIWDYQAIKVTGGTQRTATIFSKTVDLGEDQPAATPDAQLVLRDHPDWGRSAYLLLRQKAFDCGKPCTLRIAFDAAPAEDWQGKQADSGKGPALFVEDEASFIRALEKSRLVRIELPKGSGHLSALNFEVGGFAPERYAHPEDL